VCVRATRTEVLSIVCCFMAAVSCSVLHCVVVCCSVLQYVCGCATHRSVGNGLLCHGIKRAVCMRLKGEGAGGVSPLCVHVRV